MMRDTIKQIRNARKLTMKKFAEDVGINQRTMERWEQNRSVPCAKHLIKIINYCKKHNLSLDVLDGGSV